MAIEKITGLVAAPFTAFRADGSLDIDRIEAQAGRLVKDGVAGAFVCGTTGEGFSLTSEERMRVAERWTAAAPAGLRVIVHVGHASIEESRALARHAEQVGAWGTGMCVTGPFRPAGAEDLVRYCTHVAAAAPGLPFYYYHVPSVTGVNIPCSEFLAAAADRIPNLAGVKFTDENLMEYLACLQWGGGRFDALFGRDEILLAALALGARGAIGSTYNYAAPVHHRIMRAFEAGNHAAARIEQGRVNAAISAVIRAGGLAAGKATMALVGLDCGPVRPPLHSLTTVEIAALRRDLEACGFFEFASGWGS